MSAPAISIVLPAYNCDRFLKQAIDSLLNQTFTDFELLIINDGSTDNTEQVIKNYTDERIRYIKNEVNSGLIYTLNKGLQLATGKYIARMDGDDICHPERLQKQFDWLEKNAGTVAVGTYIEFIDDDNRNTGAWKLDAKTTSSSSIKNAMPKENCVAHPSVMVQKEIIQQYRYSPNQQNIEDYDLWLRMLSDGLIIEKVPEILLQYRIHKDSVTVSILQKRNPFFKQFHCKRRFLYQQLKKKKIRYFEVRVMVFMLVNLLIGVGKEVKKIFVR